MLQRRLRLLQAVSLNMSMMVGIGPFITIPTIIASMGGPQAMVGWVLGALIAVCDGLVWCELAAAFPGSGGTYHFFDAAFGQRTAGRLLKFLFVWQFFFSGPLEIATGAIGLAHYVSFFFPLLRKAAWPWAAIVPGLSGEVAWLQVAAMAVMVLVTFMAYRRVEVAGRLMVILWVGMLLSVGFVIVSGLFHFNPRQVFDVPPDAWAFDRPHLAGLGMALGIAMYDYLGYYQICYLGDEVTEPSRTIPRSILISVGAVTAMYLTMNASILGVLPWREVAASQHVASDMMLRLYGSKAAGCITVLIIWTALAAAFAGLLGYSRVPYASARAGHFFRFFAATHPTGQFPHRALLLLGGVAIIACLFDLGTVILALLTSRILIQFVGQIVTVWLLRAHLLRGPAMPFLMPFFPIPAIVALLGWLFVFATSGWHVLAYGMGTMAVGIAAFVVWDRQATRKAKPSVADHSL
jgi:amino acid transporter